MTEDELESEANKLRGKVFGVGMELSYQECKQALNILTEYQGLYKELQRTCHPKDEDGS